MVFTGCLGLKGNARVGRPRLALLGLLAADTRAGTNIIGTNAG